MWLGLPPKYELIVIPLWAIRTRPLSILILLRSPIQFPFKDKHSKVGCLILSPFGSPCYACLTLTLLLDCCFTMGCFLTWHASCSQN